MLEIHPLIKTRRANNENEVIITQSQSLNGLPAIVLASSGTCKLEKFPAIIAIGWGVPGCVCVCVFFIHRSRNETKKVILGWRGLIIFCALEFGLLHISATFVCGFDCLAFH